MKLYVLVVRQMRSSKIQRNRLPRLVFFRYYISLKSTRVKKIEWSCAFGETEEKRSDSLSKTSFRTPYAHVVSAERIAERGSARKAREMKKLTSMYSSIKGRITNRRCALIEIAIWGEAQMRRKSKALIVWYTIASLKKKNYIKIHCFASVFKMSNENTLQKNFASIKSQGRLKRFQIWMSKQYYIFDREV